MKKISGVYKITNTVTGDFYIGSSKNVKQRWANHKKPSMLKQYQNNPMYQDMQKYKVDKFVFEILEEVEPDSLKEKEQQFIEKLKPTYNDRNANGLDVEKYKKHKKEYAKEYIKSNKYKEYQKEYRKEYNKSNKYKEYQKEYQKDYAKEYKNKLCLYNSEVLTLNALSLRFSRVGIEHPTIEAKKYIIKNI